MKLYYIQNNNGSSLIEILASVVVLSIGMLGLLSIEGKGVRYTQEANLRSIAAYHLYSMLDVMRANTSAVTSNYYDFSGGIPTSRPTCTSACSAQDSASKDVFDWNNRVSTSLPSGRGTLVLNGNGRYSITVIYDTRSNNDPNPVCGNDPHNNLTCFSVDLQP